MWLKLTREDNGKQQLYNMNQMRSVFNKDNNGWLEVDDNTFHVVKESMEEIELMLKGVAPRKDDPRSRDMIGNKHKDYWDKEGR